MKLTLINTAALVIFLFAITFTGSAQTTEFAYQGNLKSSSAAANGNYDFEFALFDALSGGAQIGSTLLRNSVVVADGNFSVKLDFGSQFPGANRYLEIRVRQSGQPGITTLAPRQQINTNPYSVKSLTANTATSATSADSAVNATNAVTAATATNALQLGGVAANQFVLTGDARLSDARAPTAGSTNYIQNTISPQASSNFNVSGDGTAGGTLSANLLSSATQLNLSGGRALSITNNNTFVGSTVGLSTTGAGNTFVGFGTGNVITSGLANTALGQTANFGAPNLSNSTAIGAWSRVDTSNSMVLGAVAGINNATTTTNVGIGTTTPTERLHVVGNGLFTGNLTVNGTLTATIPAGTYIQNSTSQQSNSNFSISGNGFINGYGGVGTASNTILDSPARFSVFQGTSGQWSGHIASGNFAPGNSYGLLIDAGTNNNDEALRIRSQGGLSTLFSVKGSGGVGIGTDAPATHLHLKANEPTGFSILLENTSTAKRFYLANYGSTGGGNHWPGLDSANTSFLLAENSLVLTTPGGIMFSGSTTAEHMRISPNGNIGIGTTNPFSKMEVWGNSANQFASLIRTVGLANNTSFGLAVRAGTTSTDTALEVFNQGGNSLMRVRGDGNVGIGASNPGSKLHVATTNAANAAQFDAPTTSVALGTQAGFAIAVNSSSQSNTFTVAPDGQVGVGLPRLGGFKFEVAGSSRFAGNANFDGWIKANNLPSGGLPVLCLGGDNVLNVCGSSRRFKDNINSFTGGLDLVRRLNPVTFDWKSDGTHDLGLVAEDVEVIDPLLATYRDGIIQGVKYDRIGVVLINAVKEQQAQIEELKVLVSTQAQTIEMLKKLICADKRDMAVCR